MNIQNLTKTNKELLETLKWLDMEWYRLIQEAKEIGLTIEEVKSFLLNKSQAPFKD